MPERDGYSARIVKRGKSRSSNSHYGVFRTLSSTLSHTLSVILTIFLTTAKKVGDKVGDKESAQ
jgi:hypothetical protein